jgi:hypothetical protein
MSSLLVSPSQLSLSHQRLKHLSESTVNLIGDEFRDGKRPVNPSPDRDMEASSSSLYEGEEVSRLHSSHGIKTSMKSDDDTDCGDIKAWIGSNSDSLPRYTCIMIFALIACYQVSDQIKEYMKYPTGVNVLVEEPKSMREALPGVTVCHNNRFMKSKIQKGFNVWLRKEMSKGYVLKNETQFDQYNLTQSFLRAKDNAHLYGTWASVDNWFKYTIEANDFIPFLKCDQSWRRESDPFKECEKYPIIESMQYSGRCFTLFHAMSSDPKVGREIGTQRLNSLVRNPKTSIEDFVQRNSSVIVSPRTTSTSTVTNESFTVSSNVLSDKTQSYDFDGSEIIQMMLDFHPEESTDPYASVGGKIYIHDIAHIPGLEEMYFDLQPGFYYELYIRAITTRQLPYPYNTRCMNYTAVSYEWMRRFKIIGGIASTQVECINLCLAEKSIKDCGGLWPPEVPYFRKTKYSNKTYHNEYYGVKHSIRWGGWKDRHSMEGDHHHYFLCVSLYKPMCMNLCGVDCL